MVKQNTVLDEPAEFSLVQGGPFYQLLVWAGLMKPPMGLLARRIIVFSAVTWLPLLVLTFLSGHAIGGQGIPFLYDLGAHVRLLLCVPMFLTAEVIVHRRLQQTVGQFLDCGIVATDDQPRFEALISSAMRLRNSVLAEVLLLTVTLVGGYLLGQHYIAMQSATWYAVTVGDRMQITGAGYWYFFVSLTIFRFLFFQWYFRLLIWYRFLWQVSRKIPLRLNALHPDRSGGLAFLQYSAFAFALVLMAHSVGLAGILGGKIWHEGATLPQFKLELAAWLVFLIMLVLAPLIFFAIQLATAKRTGLREYNIVANQYVDRFRRKWIEGHSAKEETLVGTADIQSLADLSNSFQVVQEMGLIPFRRSTVLQLALLTALPLAPLVLTMVPLDQLLDRTMSLFI